MKFYSLALKIFCALLVFIAGTGISPFCWCGQYEPEVPKALKEKAL